LKDFVALFELIQLYRQSLPDSTNPRISNQSHDHLAYVPKSLKQFEKQIIGHRMAHGKLGVLRSILFETRQRSWFAWLKKKQPSRRQND
jgi:hypothetical protein